MKSLHCTLFVWIERDKSLAVAVVVLPQVPFSVHHFCKNLQVRIERTQCAAIYRMMRWLYLDSCRRYSPVPAPCAHTRGTLSRYATRTGLVSSTTPYPTPPSGPLAACRVLVAGFAGGSPVCSQERLRWRRFQHAPVHLEQTATHERDCATTTSELQCGPQPRTFWK